MLVACLALALLNIASAVQLRALNAALWSELPTCPSRGLHVWDVRVNTVGYIHCVKAPASLSGRVHSFGRE
eukprot:2328308-Alexandrium_andersonii.AAC.1